MVCSHSGARSARTASVVQDSKAARKASEVLRISVASWEDIVLRSVLWGCCDEVLVVS